MECFLCQETKEILGSCAHFTDEETEAQQGTASMPKVAQQLGFTACVSAPLFPLPPLPLGGEGGNRGRRRSIQGTGTLMATHKVDTFLISIKG